MAQDLSFNATCPRRPLRAAVCLLLAALLLLPAARALAQLDPVLATVNGTLITERDMDYYLVELRLEQPALWEVPNPVLHQRLLGEVSESHLLHDHFWRDGFEEFAEPDARQAALRAWQEFSRLAGSEWQLRAILEESGIREEDFRRWLFERSKREWLVRSGLTSQVEARYFNRADDTPAHAARVLLSSIEFRAVPDGSNRAATSSERHLARERAARVHLEIVQGLPFDRAAAIHGDNPSAKREGGSMGWVEVAAMDPVLREAVLQLRPGGVTPPLEIGDSVLLLRMAGFETKAQEELRGQLDAARERALAEARPRSEVVLAERFEAEEEAQKAAGEAPDLWARILDLAEPPAPDP